MMLDALFFAAILAADRITKALVPHFMELHQSIPVIPHFVNLTYVRNTGGAFGILATWDSPLRRGFFILASLAAMGLLVFLYRRAVSGSSRLLRFSLVAIGGGAFGNLYDRAVSGEVVDFIDVFIGSHHWPAFNVADSAISVGAVLLGYLYLTGRTDLFDEEEESNAA